MNHIKSNITEQKPFPIAIVVSLYNQDVTTQLLQGGLERLKALGFSEDQITVVEVPGAVEIPLIVNQLASQKKYQAIIAYGAVIRGETSHYDYVCQQVSDGCQQVMMTHNLPVIFGVLTTENMDQALDRVGGRFGHKGIEAAEAAVAMVSVTGQVVSCHCEAV